MVILGVPGSGEKQGNLLKGWVILVKGAGIAIGFDSLFLESLTKFFSVLIYSHRRNNNG